MRVLSDDQQTTDELPEITDLQIEILSMDKTIMYIDAVVESVLAALPHDQKADSTVRANVEGALRSGKLQAWALTGYVDKDKPEQLLGFTTTLLRIDEFTRKKYLLIYSVNAYAKISLESWKVMFALVSGWAKDQGVHHIVSYTQNPRMIEVARAIGGLTGWVELYYEIPSEE